MPPATPLADAFLTLAVPAVAQALGPAAVLEPRLRALCERARAAWPGVDVPDVDFVRHVATRLAAEADPASALESLRGDELYLAQACALGDAAAVALFDRRYMPEVARHLAARGRAFPAFDDDFKQQLRTRVLVPEGTGPPRIASYAGRGPLGAWLCVAAVRMAINMKAARGASSVPLAEDEPLPAGPGATDPELGYLRAHYGAVLREATAAALSALAPRHATVLRLFFLQGVTSQAIAEMLQISTRTVRRLVADARAQILEETRKRLAERLQITSTQLDSIIRLSAADLGPSIIAFLNDSADS